MQAIFGVAIFHLFISVVFSQLLRPNLFTEKMFVLKTYSDNTCSRRNTVEDFKSAAALKTQILKNSLVCSATNNLLSLLGRKKRAAQSWKMPGNLPDGSKVAFCSDVNKCCNPRKSLNTAGTHYSLCRECVHLVTLPASYVPRQHYHVTCQDADYYETCLTGEGGCATNMVTRTVNFNTKEVYISLGHSCSCEILRNSVFSDFI